MKTVLIASIPERELMLKKTILSLASQVDRIYVSLNNYDYIPKFLKPYNAILTDNSKGDSERYRFVDDIKGYIFTVDDDLMYPANYINTLIKGVDKYRCVCSLHGRSYPNRPIRGFQKDFNGYPCLGDVMQDTLVDVGGTGVMGWHSYYLKVRYENFGAANMADIWFAKLCYEQNIKIVCLAHRQGYLKYQYPLDTIWDQENKKGFIEQTKLLRSFLK
jgi:hypothetical protein